MNQILQVEEKKNNYRSSSTIDIKKIVLFFAIAILIFGAILLGQGAYSIYLRQINKPVKPDNPVIKTPATRRLSRLHSQCTSSGLKVILEG